MSLIEIVKKFSDTYYSPARFDEESWNAAQQDLLGQAETKKQKLLVSELDRVWSDFEASGDEQDQIKDKFFFSTTFRPKVWHPLFNTSKSQWVDWVIGYSNQKIRTASRLDEEDVHLAKTVFNLSPAGLGKNALPLLSMSVFSSDHELAQTAWNQIVTMGAGAKGIGRDLVVAKLFADVQVATPAADVFGVEPSEEVNVLEEFIINPRQFTLTAGAHLPDRLDIDESLLSQKINEAKDIGLSRLFVLGKDNAETAGLVVQALTRLLSPDADPLNSGQEIRILFATSDIALAYPELKTQCLNLIRQGLKSEDPNVKFCALQCLDDCKDLDEQGVLPDIKSCTQDPDTRISISAYQILGDWALVNTTVCSSILPDFITALSHPDLKVRCEVAVLLGNLGTRAKSAVPTMKQQFIDEKETASMDALTAALEKIDPQALQDPKIIANKLKISKQKVVMNKQQVDKEIAENAGVLGAMRDGSELDSMLVASGMSAADFLSADIIDLTGKSQVIELNLDTLDIDGDGVGDHITFRVQQMDYFTISVRTFVDKSLDGFGVLNLDQTDQFHFRTSQERFSIGGWHLNRLKFESDDLVMLDRYGNGRSISLYQLVVPHEKDTGNALGGLGTKGRGSGADGYGQGGGSFGSKGEGAIGAIGGDPVILGALDKSLIEAVVRRNLNQIRYCYQRELTKTPALAGKIVVKFVIAEDGTVSSASTESTTMNYPRVESCLCGRFMRFQFPQPKDGKIVTVTYPFVFSPK